MQEFPRERQRADSQRRVITLAGGRVLFASFPLDKWALKLVVPTGLHVGKITDQMHKNPIGPVWEGNRVLGSRL